MLSKKTKYGLNALVYLARSHGKNPVLISDLATHEKIPLKFLEAILLELKKNGILLSKKGKGGGYSLGKKPTEITLGQVIRLLNGPLAPVPCVSQSAYEKCEECVDEHLCGLRSVMKEVRDSMTNILDKTTLADVIRRSEEMVKNTSVNYTI